MKYHCIHNRPVENDCYDEFITWCRDVAGVQGIEYTRWSDFFWPDSSVDDVCVCMMQDPIGRKKASVFPPDGYCRIRNRPRSMNLCVRDLTYLIWHQRGLPCPGPTMAFDYHEHYEFPFILKWTAKQMGRAYLVDSDERRDWVTLEAANFRAEKFRVVPFIDTRYSDGFYRMHRYVVCGDSAIPVILAKTRGWMCKVGKMSPKKTDVDAWLDEFIDFYETPIPTGVIESVRAVGLDFAFVDCTIREDGSLILWELNPYMNLKQDNIARKDLNYYPFLSNFLFGTSLPVERPSRAELKHAFLNFEGYEKGTGEYWRKRKEAKQ